MAFIKEPVGYEKTALSNLQGSWANLRDSVVEHFGFTNAQKLLFHVDEATIWESVRNLEQMKQTLIVIQNIAAQSDTPDEIVECVDMVREDLKEVLTAISEGDRL